MAYLVFNNNGSLLVRVPTGTINTSTTSLTLIGRDVTNFGSFYNQNLIILLGNSASETNFPPRAPITGQLWWDKTYQKLKAYDTSYGAWLAVGAAIPSYSQLVGQEPGEFWYDSTNKNLNFIDNDGQYNTLTSFPKSKFSGWKYPLTSIVDDTQPTALSQDITLLQHYGNTVGAISSEAFTVGSASTSNFSSYPSATVSLVKGLTIIGDAKVTGNISFGQLTSQYLSVSIDLDRVSPGSVLSTSTVATQNSTIISDVLNKMFPTTGNLYNENGLPIGSEARVFCTYSSGNLSPGYHVRRFSVNNSSEWEVYVTTATPSAVSVVNLVY